MDQTFSIEILGRQFTFTTDADVREAKEVADYIVESINRASQQCEQKTVTPDKWAILILAALNIANDYFELKKRHQQLLTDINRRSENLLHTLESQIA